MDPFRLDEIEIYSNMLYVMNKKAKLAQIAHEYAQIDKNRAEVCCLIGNSDSTSSSRCSHPTNRVLCSGNYFSSRDEHMKAIQYFKRSLQLNRDYLPAWTLMGHEFVELKNSHAAIEAYRRAVGEWIQSWRGSAHLIRSYQTSIQKTTELGTVWVRSMNC